MRGARLGNLACWLVLMLSTAGAAAQPAPSPLPEIDSCVRQLDPQLDIGFDHVVAKCPELAGLLEHSAWAPWLPKGWNEPGNDLSAGGLKELRELLNRESRAGMTRPAPQASRLKGILTGIATKSSVGPWSRFKAWLRSILERRDQPTDESWFARMTSQIGVPQSLREIIAYTALGVVVLLAAGIIWNELRAAGLLSKPVEAGKRAAQSPAARSELRWTDLEQAPIREKVGLLLELIVRRLNDRNLLPPAGAMTARELTRVALLAEADDRARLSDLALAAERVRYSAEVPPEERLDRSIARGHELLTRLDAGIPG